MAIRLTLFAVLLVAHVQTFMLPATTGHSSAAAAVSVPRTVSPLLKAKGKQGSGPKITLKKKVKKTEAQRGIEKRIKIVSRLEKNNKKKPTIGIGRQGERYLDMSKSGTRTAVYARTEGSGAEDWTAVGHICVAAGSDLTMEGAARLQKRIILEHAAKMHPQLTQQSGKLEAGLGEEGATHADTAEGETPAVSALGAARPSSTTPEATLKLAAACGFQGLPIPDHGHYWKESARGLAERVQDGEDALREKDTMRDKVQGIHRMLR